MKVPYLELEIAFSAGDSETQYWLDKQTGEVIVINEEMEIWATGEEEIEDLPGWAQLRNMPEPEKENFSHTIHEATRNDTKNKLVRAF